MMLTGAFFVNNEPEEIDLLQLFYNGIDRVTDEVSEDGKTLLRKWI